MKVLVFPKDTNPYQNLLYETLQRDYPELIIKYFKYHYHPNIWINYILLPFILIKKRFNGYSIFHLHWLYNFSASHQNPYLDYIHRIFLVAYIIFFFLFIKVLGYKLVWTVHNVLPHERQTANDVLFTKWIAYLCDAKIVHSHDTIDQLKKIKVSTQNTRIIPFGNFAKVYINEINKNEAKKHFNLDDQSFVFLFFGFIRKYKGVDRLLDAFKKIVESHPHAKLLIAGQSLDNQITKYINESNDYYPDNVKPYIRNIKDQEIQYFLNAADIVVYPFIKVTTSSSVFLALQFKKPIIYPKLGNLSDLPDNIGISYVNTNTQGLYNSMKEAIDRKDDLDQAGMRGYIHTNSLSWKKAAMKTYEVYKKI